MRQRERTRTSTAGYWVRDGQLLRARWGMIVQVFSPSPWALHRWAWWGVNVALDWIWSRLLRPVLSLVIRVPVGRPFAKYRGREPLLLARPDRKVRELTSTRVVEVLRLADRGTRR